MGLEAKALYAFPTFGVSFLQLGSWREGFRWLRIFSPCRFGMHLLPTVKKGWCKEHVGFIHVRFINASLIAVGDTTYAYFGKCFVTQKRKLPMYSFVGRKIQVRYDQIQPEI